MRYIVDIAKKYVMLMKTIKRVDSLELVYFIFIECLLVRSVHFVAVRVGLFRRLSRKMIGWAFEFLAPQKDGTLLIAPINVLGDISQEPTRAWKNPGKWPQGVVVHLRVESGILCGVGCYNVWHRFFVRRCRLNQGDYFLMLGAGREPWALILMHSHDANVKIIDIHQLVVRAEWREAELGEHETLLDW
jgi:hypothetical protein